MPARIMLLVLATVLAPTTALHSATAQRGQDALLKLLRPPTLHATMGVSFTASSGFEWWSSSEDNLAEIKRLTVELKGDYTDLPRLLRLAQLYATEKQVDEANKAFDRALELGQKRAEAQPQNAKALAQYGHVLQKAGKTDEAEAVLRRAVTADAKSWEAWDALAVFLIGRIDAALLRTAAKDERSDPWLQTLILAAQKKIPAADLEEAERLAREAREAIDKAVALAPQEGRPYGSRALVGNAQGRIRHLKEVGGGAEPDFRKLITIEEIADLWRWAELTPDDPKAMGKAACLEILNIALKAGNKPTDVAEGKIWNRLSEKDRDSVRAVLNRLNNLSQNPNPKSAADACMVLGTVQAMILQDSAGAEASLRRALVLNPANRQAASILIANLAGYGKFAELLEISEAQVKQMDSVYFRIAAVKAALKIKQLDRARTHAEAALKLEPAGYLPNVTLAVVSLLKEVSPENLERAHQLIQRAGSAKGFPESQAQWIELGFTAAVVSALSGQNDSARTLVEQILKADPENEEAKALRPLLD